jgi:sugar/nucleoside kinase (ribokinase family)
MSSAAFDCLCMGILVADHVCEPIDHVPNAGELVLTERTTLSIGGCAANVATCLAKLGRRVAVVGRVGDDSFGRFVIDGLGLQGVDCRHVRATPGVATSCSLIVNVRGQDRRFIHARGANTTLAGDEMTADMLRDTRVVYVGGYCLSEQPSPANVARVFEAARRNGVKTVLDVVIPERRDYWPFLEPVLPWTDVFLPNGDEAEIITGSADPLRQAKRFQQAGAATVVITRGGDGCLVVGLSKIFRAGRFDVDFVDGTGSGDAFAAGYIHSLLQGAAIEDCVRIGSALGATCVRATGATAGVLNTSELAAFLAAHPLEINSMDPA